MKKETIINYEEVTPTDDFRIFWARPASFGYLFLTRSLWCLDCDGARWQQNTFAVLAGLLTVATVALDIVAIFVAWSARLLWYLVRSLWSIVIFFLKTVINKLFGTVFKWLAAAAVVIILYLKWDEISAIIRCWHW